MTQTEMPPSTGTAYELVRRRAEQGGDLPAVVGVDGAGGHATVLTYRQLLARVDDLAARLCAAGADVDRPVAVCLGRTADSVPAMLAVFAAGAAYCPVDPATPVARTRAILDRLGVRLAVADRDATGGLPDSVTVVPPAPSGPAPALPARAPAPSSLAYVLHTSGSSGEPKAVAMTHRGLRRLIRWQLGNDPPGLRTLQFTATSFDVTFQEVLSTLATGGCLVVAAEHVRRDPDALLDTIRHHRVQRLFLPYVALQLLAVAATRRAVVPDTLRSVVTAGERLVVTPAIRAFFGALPGCRLDNHYGPTETHLVTCHRLPADPMSWPETPSIGRPVGDVRCQVLDDNLRPVGLGEPGELYVGGPGLARGYLSDPAGTAQRFVADPAGGGAPVYRTGDVVRPCADGTYDFVGRADRQLKVHGFRVEPAEVENALLRHPQVDAAAVGTRAVADGVSTLVGYLQAHRPPTHRALTEHLRQLLPEHLVPSRFVMVDALPRTASGKVDPRALAEMEPAGDTAASTPPSAGDSPADAVVAIWRRVLGHDEFGIDDDFFDVGGDSILATWVVTELAQYLGRPVGLSTLLDHGTVAELVEALEPDGLPRGGSGVGPSQLVTLRPGPSGRVLYLVHPLGGELIGYRELARAARSPFRILGIGWAGAPPAPGTSLVDIARTHVEHLRTIQPDGPYLLAGWSFGGVLAYEMARQLRVDGARVDLLGLLDANPVRDPITGLPIDRTPFLGVFDEVVARLADPAAGPDEVVKAAGETWTQLMGTPIDPAASGGYLRGVLDTARACLSAAMRYRPAPYDGPVTLFQAGDSGREHQEALAAALRDVCIGTVTTVPLAGDHHGLMHAPHVATTAAMLDAALEVAGTERKTIV